MKIDIKNTKLYDLKLMYVNASSKEEKKEISKLIEAKRRMLYGDRKSPILNQDKPFD